MLVRAAVPLAALLLAAPAAPRHAAERVAPNDNRRAAGQLRDGTLALRLEARLATWHPDGDAAPGVVIPAFGEAGGPAQVPGPLVRVRAGSRADVTLRNALGDTLRVHGLHARPAAGADVAPLVLAPGETRRVRFALDAPGTYHYWATTTRRAIDYRTLEDAQLTGAIVVDDSVGPAAPDRIFVIGMWTDTVHRALTKRRRILSVINGRSWPYTERLSYGVGDSVRWRIINGSADLHPMHLHGFYFRLDARGDGVRDTVYAPDARRLAVTENAGAGTTLRMTWVPERPGNWLFHCHVPEHFGPRGPLGTELPAARHLVTQAGRAHDDHARSGMSGLVLGVTVRPPRSAAAPGRPPAAARAIRLLVRPNVGYDAQHPVFGYTVHEGGAEPPPDSGLGVGPPLDLVRGQPVRITVVNRLAEPTAVHWHGIELESYFDGVPGFSGMGRSVTPMIAPGDSFVVRFTPPRAGTFIYHTHADEMRQQLGGLAGALVVRDSSAPRDASRDIPVVISAPLEHDDSGRIGLLNGRQFPAPLELRVGTTYRFRLVQMSAARSAVRVAFTRDSALLQWTPVAKDGADLPPALRRERAATIQMGIGETWDYEVTPTAPGEVVLQLRAGVPPGQPLRGVQLAAWRMVVRRDP